MSNQTQPDSTARITDTVLVNLYNLGDFWRWELVGSDGSFIQQGFGDDRDSAHDNAADAAASL
jgi:hypothetical protein